VAPGPPVVPGQKPNPPDRTGSPSNQTGGSSSGDSQADAVKPSNANGAGQRGVDIGTPARTNETAPNQGSPSNTIPASPRTNIRMQDIADRPDEHTRRPPALNIPPQAGIGRPVVPQASESQPSTESTTVPAAVPRVPSCVLTGRQLDNFALYDLEGQPWEFRKHRGRVVMIDFWGTWCGYCREAIPHLNNLYRDYGPHGLEIIGIAYETEGTLQEQLLRVKHFRDRVGINYRLLLGGEETACPVKAQFEIHGFPTLVLLDANNRIIWRCEGLNASKLQDLKIRIAQQLGLP
jgi:thiol-disulfide isomerase/thioredoxin